MTLTPDGRLARLEERSKYTVDTLQRVESKLDSLNDKLWAFKVKMAGLATVVSILVSAVGVAVTKALGL